MTFLDWFYAAATVLTVLWVATVLAVATYDHDAVTEKLSSLKVARRLQKKTNTGTKCSCSDCLRHNRRRDCREDLP